MAFFGHRRNLVMNTEGGSLGRGGGQNRPWVLGVKLKTGEDCFEPVLNIHTPLSPILTPFYLLLLNSVVIKISLVEK